MDHFWIVLELKAQNSICQRVYTEEFMLTNPWYITEQKCRTTQNPRLKKCPGNGEMMKLYYNLKNRE